MSQEIRIKGVNWKGEGVNALKKMSDAELEAYVQKLETLVNAMHQHFWYYSPRFSQNGAFSMEDMGFDGQWKSLGVKVMAAALEMYKVHSTPFRPVERPKGAGIPV